MNNFKKKISDFLDYIFAKNANHQIWIVSTVVLFIILGFIATYSYQANFNSSLNTQKQVVQTQQQNFQLPVTVVYDSSSQDQKTKVNEFLSNLTDPQKALMHTDLQTTWLDAKSPQGMQLIQQSGLKYLPQIFISPVIEQHPQFSALKQYLNKKGNIYFIRVAALEHIEAPPVNDGHVRGVDPAKAKVVVQAYESYSCADCAGTQDILNKIAQNYPTNVSIIYKHFEPGDVYNQIAQGAECAADQNKFLEMNDLIFKGQPAMVKKLQSLTKPADASAAIEALLKSYAKELGLNGTVFQTCLNDKVHYNAINQQTLDAIDYGISAPPSFFINQQFITEQNSVPLTYNDLKTVIDAELAK